MIIMDSQPPPDGYLLDFVDSEWREDQLPFDQIQVPTDKLPDPEADSGDSHLTLTEQVNAVESLLRAVQGNFKTRLDKIEIEEQRWTDLALSSLAPELGISDQINITGA